MWTKRISSKTPEHPASRDVLRALLSHLLERGVETSWAHFEVVAQGGWFDNLLSGKQPWIEVAFANQQTLQLNLGLSKGNQAQMPTVPAGWPQADKGLWSVPVSELEELIAWIDQCLIAASGNPDYKVSGWLEGL